MADRCQLTFGREKEVNFVEAKLFDSTIRRLTRAGERYAIVVNPATRTDACPVGSRLDTSVQVVETRPMQIPMIYSPLPSYNSPPRLIIALYSPRTRDRSN